MENYPRIMTNGEYYRIETRPEVWEKDYGQTSEPWIWTSKWLWVAKRKIRSLLREQAIEESLTHGPWRPI